MIDIVSIPDTKENFRLLYDVKGRFSLVKVDEEEAKVSISCSQLPNFYIP